MSTNRQQAHPLYLPATLRSCVVTMLVVLHVLACSAATGTPVSTDNPEGAGPGMPSILELTAHSTSSISQIDPAVVAVHDSHSLASSGFTPGNPASAVPVGMAVEWGIYGVSGFGPDNIPLYLDLDLTGSDGNPWLALADYDSGGWDWQPLVLNDDNEARLSLPQDRMFYKPGDGSCFFALAASGSGNLQFHGGQLTGSKTLADSMHVTHRSGQSFITWPEDQGQECETYRVYRYTSPPSGANLAAAEMLFEVPEGSGRFHAGRYRPDDQSPFTHRYLERYVISDLGAQLPQSTGLLVWTIQDGQDSAGEYYYGITVVDSEGVEDISGLGGELGFGPVEESVADPLPVEALTGDNGRAHLFIQYMDLANWNPTFDAPNALNYFYGLDPEDWQTINAIQYAYCYIVSEPDPVNLVGLPPANPVILYLHGWGGLEYRPELNGTEWYTPMLVTPIDYNNTWFFGFARDHDYRAGGEFSSTDKIANYTERRLLRIVHDLMRHPALGPKVDPQRIYLWGGSMGGTGCLALAQRYPNVFACAYAALPMTEFTTSTRWLPKVSAIWGDPARDLGVEIVAPNGWAGHLGKYQGTSVWDWQSHQKQLEAGRSVDMVPTGIKHGRLDDVIDWTTQGKPIYSILNTAGQCWGGATLDIGHENINWEGMPAGLMHLTSGSPYGGSMVIRDESVPGLTNCTADSDLPPADGPGAPGYWNRTIDWSASWNDWQGAPIDLEHEWEMAFRTTDGSTQRVDITPRRLQQFVIDPDGIYSWLNIRSSDGTTIENGDITPDADGLLTVPQFKVTGTGNRLILVRTG